jgi:dTMP kinase
MSRLAHRALDRFEQEDGAFFSRVADGFQAMAADDPSRWVIIDATGDADVISATVRQAVKERLGL